MPGTVGLYSRYQEVSTICEVVRDFGTERSSHITISECDKRGQ